MPNLATVLVGLAVFGAFAAVIGRAIRNRKNGKGCCSRDCGGCPGGELCRRKK